jgi:hypothetical protein
VAGYKHLAPPGPGSEFANVAEQRPGRAHKRSQSGAGCTNCGGKSHTKENCWQAGGGAEGQKPAWMVMRDAERAAAASRSTDTKPPPRSSAVPPPRSSTVPSLAAVVNAPDDVVDYGSLPDYSCASVSSLALSALSGDAVLLDSGATSHIIRNRRLFWSYNTTRASDVQTANHGTLRALARGDCLVILHCESGPVCLWLRDCLHAPDAVSNLLSVGRLVNKGFRCSFASSAVTISSDPGSGATFSFTGPLTGPLALLPLEFVAPECAAYARVAVTRDLWHVRMGHVGEQAIRDLAKSTSGISLGGPPFSICKSCIKWKHPRSPHPASLSRAERSLDLIQSDICGPFPFAPCTASCTSSSSWTITPTPSTSTYSPAGTRPSTPFASPVLSGSVSAG